MNIQKSLFAIFFATICTTGYSANNDFNNARTKKDSVYISVKKMPKFPGGDRAMFNYIADNVKYPESAIEKGLCGKVYVQFVINKKGRVVNTQIAKGIDSILDNEALRVVQNMPQWEPGKKGWKRVNVAWMIPIEFKFNKNSVFYKNSVQMVLMPNNETNTIDTVYSFDDVPQNPIYYLDEFPEYPGGDLTLRRHIAENVKYPETAKQNGLSGRILVQFVVNENGEIGNVQIKNGIHPILNKEVIRVVKRLPQKFKPGKIQGKPVKVLYTTTINFQLE